MNAHQRGLTTAIGILAVSLGTTACGPDVPEGVPVEEEPRHRLVSDEAFAQVLDVQILGGDTTLYHTHARPMAYVCVNVSPVATQATDEEWAAPGEPCERASGFSTPEHADTPLTHRVANAGDDLFHLIAVQSLRDASARTALGAAGPGTTLVDDGWFRMQAIALGPEEFTGPHRHEVETLLVLAAGAGAASMAPDGRENILVEPGAFRWFGPGVHDIAAVDGVALRLVEVEVR